MNVFYTWRKMFLLPVQQPQNPINLSFTGIRPSSANIPKKMLEKNLYEGMTVKDISVLYNVSTTKVYQLIDYFNLPNPNKIRNSVNSPFMKKLDEKVPVLLKQGKSLTEICEIISEKKALLVKWLKLHFPNGYRETKKIYNREILASHLTNDEIAEMKGIKRSSVRSMRVKYGIPKYNPQTEENKRLLQENILHAINIKELAAAMNWPYDKTQKYVKKYNLKETLENNLKLKITELTQQGLGKYAVAKELGMSVSKLRNLLKKYEMETVFDDHKLKIKRAVQQMRAEKYSFPQIARTLGISPRTALNYMKEEV